MKDVPSITVLFVMGGVMDGGTIYIQKNYMHVIKNFICCSETCTS